MTEVFTEGRHAGEFIMSEDGFGRSRDTITISSAVAGVVAAGTVLSKVPTDGGAVTVGNPAFTGTGNGALTKATPAYGAGVLEGTYRITCIEPATDAGTFEVVGPDGVAVGIATVGVAFDGVVKFTIADGSQNFVAGDVFTLAVSIANAANAGEYIPAVAGGSADAINIYAVDATSADQAVAAITRDAQVNGNILTYDASVDDAPKKAALVASLAEKGIIVR